MYVYGVGVCVRVVNPFIPPFPSIPPVVARVDVTEGIVRTLVIGGVNREHDCVILPTSLSQERNGRGTPSRRALGKNLFEYATLVAGANGRRVSFFLFVRVGRIGESRASFYLANRGTIGE